MKKIVTLAAVLLFLCGAGVLAYPGVSELLQREEQERQIRQFEEETREEVTGEYPELLESMQEYNSRIFSEGQADLRDAFSYEDSVFDLKEEGIRDAMMGYLTIDAMDIRVPLYLGASEEHLREGAAVLGQTSMPVGGQNTNCVIAAHRGGYHGEAMFRDIELLEKGDAVVLENLWERMEYTVVKSLVIEPDDIEAVKIVEGEDLLTLVTCHPYGHNYQRYVVYCARSDSQAPGESQMEGKLPSGGVPYRSSQGAIQREELLERAAMAGALFFVLLIPGAAVVRRILRKYRK